jgi:hypothetical protein
MKKARDAVASNATGMQRAMEKVKGSFTGTMDTIINMKNLLAGIAGAAVALWVRGWIKGAIDTADQLSKMSQKVGVTTEDLSVLAHAAALSDVSLEDLGTSLARLSKNAQDTAQGTGDAKDAFGAMNISVKNTDGSLKANIDLLKEVSSKLAGMEDGTTKTSVAMKLFGRSGAELIPLLNSLGSEGFDKVKQKVSDMGGILSTSAGLAAEEFNDRITDLQFRMNNLARVIISDALPAVNRWTDAVGEAYQKGGLWAAVLKGITSAIAGDDVNAMKEKAEILKKSIAEMQASLSKMTEPQAIKMMQTSITSATAYLATLETKIKAVTDADEKAYTERKAQADKEAASKKAVTDAIQRELEMQGKREAAAKAAAADADRLKKLGEGAILNLEREKTATGDVTREEKMRWETTQGQYKDISAAHKDKLIQLSKELDTIYLLADADAERKKIQDAIIGQMDSIKEQAATYGMSATQATLYKLAVQGASEEQLALAESFLTTIERQERLQNLYSGLSTAQDEYNKTVKDLAAAYADLSIPLEEYIRLLGIAQQKLDGSLKEQKDNLGDLKSAVEGWARSSADAIVDFALTGKTSFTDMAQSIIADILKMIIYQKMFSPWVTQAFGGEAGAGSWLGNLFGGGKATGGPVSGGKMYEVNERGTPELLSVGNRHFLMMAGQSGHVTAAKNIEKSGSGSGRGRSGDVNVTIINNAGAEIGTNSKQNASGGIDLEVIVDTLMAQKLGQFGSSSNKVMRQNFNTSQRLVSR